MGNDVQGAKPSAGRKCPALSQFCHATPAQGCNDGRVFREPFEKLAEIERAFYRILKLGVRGQRSEVGSQRQSSDHLTPALSPKGGEGGDCEKVETLKSEFNKWIAKGAKLFGLAIIAACVSGELSTEPNLGQTIHAHGGHENKRVVVKRPGERGKDDECEPHGPPGETAENDPHPSLRDTLSHPMGEGTGCEWCVNLCEHRTADGVCQIQQRFCHWIDQNRRVVIGRLAYLPGFKDVWLDDAPFNLRNQTKARLCLEFMASKEAFNPESALHFLDEIDPHVRETGNFIKLSEIQMKDYFRGPLAKLRHELVKPVGGNGKYYLKTGAV